MLLCYEINRFYAYQIPNWSPLFSHEQGYWLFHHYNKIFSSQTWNKNNIDRYKSLIKNFHSQAEKQYKFSKKKIERLLIKIDSLL